MSFIDILRDARDTPSSIYQQYLLNISKTEDVHAFLEGKDDPSFYLSFLSSVVSDLRKIQVYRCKNKKNVYETYYKVMQRGKHPTFVLFFVDKDHDDLVGEVYETARNIYVTDFYSIENYIVSENMLRRMWEDFIGTNDFDREKVFSKFNDELVKFYSYVLPVSAWIIFCRRRGLKPCLDNIKLSKLFSFNDNFDLQTTSDTELIPYLENACGINNPDDIFSELPQVINELSKIEPKKHIRGKYELWFLIKFFERVVDLLKMTAEGINKPLKVPIQLSEGCAVLVLAPRVQIPSSLLDFFKANGLTK